MEPITGTAAGVPFTALPPAADGPAPLLITWHMMDAPCTDAAFAAALPLHDVPAWRVHLGMPLCGARSPRDRDAAFVELVQRDPVLAYIDPVVRQAADEFPAALAELRERLPIDDGPIGVVGGSLGGAVALRVLARRETPIAAAALINAAIRARSVVGLVEGVAGAPYQWHEESQRIADRLDFVARADEVAGPPLLVVSGELDFPTLRTDAAELTDALRGRYADPEHARLAEIPGLAHPLAEPPGIEPAPQSPVAKAVDDVVTEWFRRYLRPQA